MRHAFSVLAILGFTLILTAQNNQPDIQSGDFMFRMPPGWKGTQNGNLTVLSAPMVTPGTTTSMMLATYGMVQDLRTSFGKVWEVLLKSYRIEEAGQVIAQRLPCGNDAVAISAVASDNTGKRWAASLVMAQSGNRSEVILFTSDDLQPQALAASKTALSAFLANLHFRSGEPGPDMAMGNPAANPMASAPVPMAGAQGRIAGIYRAATRPGVDPVASLDIFDSAKKTPDYTFLTFFPDGHVKKGLIPSGFDGYFVDSFFRHDVANGGAIAAKWGQYQIGGGQGRIIFANGALAGQQLISGLRGEVWSFTQLPDRLQVQGETYYLLDSGNGLRLEGVYKPSGDTTQPGIKFTGDGRFIDEGILDSKTATAIGLIGGGVGICYGFDSPRAGRGSYRISNYGLQLNYTNGKAPSSLFFIEPGSSRDKVQVLYINNVRYQRVQ
jgi:hypothetical protein